MLRIALAGGVRVEVDGRPVDDGGLGGRQGRRLLARLAWEGRAVHRDELADGIWLYSLPRTWERTLSGVITRVRVGLKDAGVPGDTITYVDGRYTLVAGGDIHVDVRDAAVDLRAARAAADEGDLERARTLAEQALEVARPPLLPGEDAGWVELARVRHRTLLLDALDVLVGIGLRGGWYGLAEGAAREAVQCEPLREAGHQLLLRTLAAKGDHAAVLTAYSACRRLLAEELGANPSPAIEAIYQEVLGVEPDPQLVPTATGHREPVVPRSPFPSTLARHAVTLVGREPALVWLWALWRRARSEAPLTVVLHGPPGAGKRSLAAVFAREVHAAGATVVHWRLGEEDSNQPAGDLGPSSLAVFELPADGGRVPSERGAALVLIVSLTRSADDPTAVALAVPPLDRASVASLAEDGLGRPPRDDELDELLATTGGWPGAVVDRVSAWADDLARALTTEATRANASLASAQSGLAEAILRGGARQRSRAHQTADDAPYKGLLRFEPEDADLFFGREQLVADVLARLSAGRVVTLLGASGSGKSSLLRAGVIADLRRGVLPGSDRWAVVLLSPGRHPLATLTACLRSATGNAEASDARGLLDDLELASPAVLIVDQFEELFTPGTAGHERVAFVDILLRGIAEGSGDHRLVLALRSDFYDACGSIPGLADAIAGSQVVVPPPTELELRRMVCGPARTVGALLEPGLVDQVITDTVTAPGALPLMSTALLGAWARRAASTVTVDAYRAAGGVAGAIANLAEGVWAGLDANEQRHAYSILMRLSLGDAVDLSNPVLRRELTSTEGALAERVLDRLVRGRLVTVDDDTVRLAHEALLREWPRLREWLAEASALRDALDHVRRAAVEWERRGREDADLYRGTRLAAAFELGATIELSTTERSFLDASADRQQSDVEGLTRRTRRLRVLSAALVALLAVAGGAGSIAVARQRQATEQARVAIAQRLTREAGSANDLDLRLLLAVEARRLEDSPEARGALLDQLARSAGVVGILRGGAQGLSRVAVSPDGKLVATGGADGRVSVWRLPGRLPFTSTAALEAPVSALAFSSQGELAAGGENGEVVRWRPSESTSERFRAHSEAILAVAFRPDGILLTAGSDGLVRAFSATTGDEEWSASTAEAAISAGFDADGSTYAQIDGDGDLSVLDVDERRTAVRASALPADEEPTTLALSADGEAVAIGGRSGAVQVIELVSGDDTELGKLTAGDDADDAPRGVEKLAFTASGDLLAAAGGAIRRFDLGRNGRVEPVQLVGGRVTDFAVDGAEEAAIAVTETGGIVRLQLGGSSLGRPVGSAGGPVTALAVGPDGVIAAAGDDQVALLDPKTGQRRVLSAPGRPVTGVASTGVMLGAGGARVFRNGGGPHGAYTVIDLESGRVLVDGTASATDVTSVALSEDGSMLAVGDASGVIRLVDAHNGRHLDQLSLPSTTAGLDFSPAGGSLIGVAGDGTVLRWSSSGRPVGRPIHVGSPASAVRVAPDGRTVAVATAGGAVIVDLTTGRVGAPMASPFGVVKSVSFGLDGAILATGGSGGVFLWDVATGRRLGDRLGPPGATTVSFDATGRRLVTGGSDGEVVEWQTDPARWTDLACELAGRPLSREEWRRYLGGRDYDPQCA